MSIGGHSSQTHSEQSASACHACSAVIDLVDDSPSCSTNPTVTVVQPAIEGQSLRLRHSFVSLMSDQGMVTEEIARLVGHRSTRTTETVYRHELRPVIRSGAAIMPGLVPGEVALYFSRDL